MTFLTYNINAIRIDPSGGDQNVEEEWQEDQERISVHEAGLRRREHREGADHRDAPQILVRIEHKLPNRKRSREKRERLSRFSFLRGCVTMDVWNTD